MHARTVRMSIEDLGWYAAKPGDRQPYKVGTLSHAFARCSELILGIGKSLRISHPPARTADASAARKEFVPLALVAKARVVVLGASGGEVGE